MSSPRRDVFHRVRGVAMKWSRTLPTLIWLAAVGFALGALIALS